METCPICGVKKAGKVFLWSTGARATLEQVQEKVCGLTQKPGCLNGGGGGKPFRVPEGARELFEKDYSEMVQEIQRAVMSPEEEPIK